MRTSMVWHVQSRGYLRIGNLAYFLAQKWWEPDELRGSCPVLRGAGAEMPRSTHPYLRHKGGFMYLVALIDVYSRYVVGWSLSNTLDTQSCIEALKRSLKGGKPDIVNTDQGCQFTSAVWVEQLQKEGVKISMTGKGRCHDNIFIERFWRSFKQEAFYLNDYRSVAELKKAIEKYVEFYNNERWHQSLNYQVPATLYKTMKTVAVLPKAA